MTHHDLTPSFRARPRIAHVTNHGYAGVDVPYGGAPDTGGQNVYVNCVAQAMVELGYHVTVFTRGGFPFFGSDRIREGIEPFGEHARYVYVPGGGDEFIRKEDIAPALDEEIDWMESFIDAEAAALGCEPWEVYELVDTHYWDAGVIGMELCKRWRARAGLALVEELLEGLEPTPTLLAERALRGFCSCGEEPQQIVGKILLETTDPLAPPTERAREAVERFSTLRGLEDGRRALDADLAFLETMSPALVPVALADVVGAAVFEAWDPRGEEFAAVEARTGRHVFTPHSLGVLKEENYRQHPLEVRRALKFCERRNHESTVCSKTRFFAATSTEIAERLRTHHGIAARSQFYFPAGIDRKVFRRYAREELDDLYEYLTEKTGKSVEALESATIVFETSRMDRTKRKDLLLEAFAKIAADHPDALCLIGGGPENAIFDECREILSSSEGLDGRAFLLGFIPDELMYQLFGRADIFVTGSEMEGFGLSAAQAAAVGSALVSSDLVPFALQYVPDDAIVVPAGDVDGFARAIARLLSDPAERARRGRNLSEKTRMLDWTEQTRAFFAHLRASGMDIARP